MAEWDADDDVGTGINFNFGLSRDEAARIMDPTAEDVRSILPTVPFAWSRRPPPLKNPHFMVKFLEVIMCAATHCLLLASVA